MRHGGDASVGTGNTEPLQEGNAELAQDLQLCLGFHAFGDQRAAASVSDLMHGAHEMQLERVGVDARDKMAVDFHELRPYLGPHAQIGEALAHVVHRDLHADAAEFLQGFLQIGKVGDRFILCQFDNNSRGWYTEAQQILAHCHQPFAAGVQTTDAHIYEKP